MSEFQQNLMGSTLTRRGFVRRAAVLGLAVPAVASILAACGGDDDDDDVAPTATSGSAGPAATATNVTVNANATATTASASAPTATPLAATGTAGGKINVVRALDSDKLDPVMTDSNADIWVFMNIYDQLIKVDDTGTGLKPGIAESWEITEDGITHTFVIRQGVMFSDGTEMTMDDILWSLERARSTEESAWVFSLAQVDAMRAVDETTFEITLTEKWAPFLSDLSLFNGSIMSQAHAESVGIENLVTQPLGTGPFALKEWKKAEYLTLMKNEHYYVEGLPLLDEVQITQVPDTNSQVLQVQGGDVDGIIGQGDVPLNRISELQSDPNLQVILWPSTWNNYVVMNVRNAPLNDVHARRALNYATDTLALIETIRFGNGEFSNSYMPRGALYWNPDQEGYPYSLENAQAELAESATPEGFSVKMMFGAGNAQAQAIATALKDMWAKINVELVLDPLDTEVVRSNYRSNEFETYQTGWTNDIIDPDQLTSYAIIPDSSENYHTGWVSQEAIDLANEARGELDPEKRRDLYYQIQKIHMDEAPFIYLYVIPYTDVLNKRVQGFFHHPMGQYVFERAHIQE